MKSESEAQLALGCHCAMRSSVSSASFIGASWKLQFNLFFEKKDRRTSSQRWSWMTRGVLSFFLIERIRWFSASIFVMQITIAATADCRRAPFEWNIWFVGHSFGKSYHSCLWMGAQLVLGHGFQSPDSITIESHGWFCLRLFKRVGDFRRPAWRTSSNNKGTRMKNATANTRDPLLNAASVLEALEDVSALLHSEQGEEGQYIGSYRGLLAQIFWRP